MPYIGRGPSKSGSFRIIDDVSSSFNGSTVAFTLQVNSSNLTVGQEQTLFIALDGVIQEPKSAYTVSGSTITFASAPATGVSFWGVELGDVGGIADAVTSNAITGRTDLGAAPATGDTLLVYDTSASSLKEMTIANLFTAPAIAGGTFSGSFTGTMDITGTVLSGASPLVFEGASADCHETTLAFTDPTADRTITFPNATGTIALTSDLTSYLTASNPTFTNTLTVGNATIVEADLETIDGLTAGTAVASKALIVDANKDIGTIRNLTIDGVFTDGNYTFDTSGNVSGLGTVGSGAITSSGVVTATGFTIGSAAITEAELEILDGASVTTTELNLLDALDRGSILYGNSSGVTTVLGQGGANTVLTSDGTDISWAAAGGGTTINGATVNELVTVAACTDELDAEANLTFDGTTLTHATTGATASVLARYDNGGYAPELQFKKSRGTSVGSYNAIQSGDNLGRLRWYGADGDSLESGAYIETMAGATWSASNRQTYMDFYVTPSGCSTTNTLTLRMTSDGQLRNKSGQVAAPTYSFHDDTNSGIYSVADDQLGIAAGGNMQWTIQNGPTFFNETASSTVGKGVVLNQGTNDNNILEFKSSGDVNHEHTSNNVGGGARYISENDTYAFFHKSACDSGGLLINANHHGGSNAKYLELAAWGNTDVRTDKDTDSSAAIQITAGLICTTNDRWRAMNACANVFGVRVMNGSAYNFGHLFIIDNEGDVFVEGSTSLSGFDSYCDPALVRAFDVARTPDTVIRSKWDDYVEYNKCTLTDAGILGKVTSDGPDARPMVNITQLQRLHNGAIWQLHTKIQDQQEELSALKVQMTALEVGR